MPLSLFSVYLAVPGLSCGVWDLVPWPGIKPGPPALGLWSLNQWTTREVPVCLFLIYRFPFYLLPMSSMQFICGRNWVICHVECRTVWILLAALHSMPDLSSLTGDQTPVHRSGSTDLNHWTTQHLCRETNTKTQMKGTPSLLKP